MRDYKDLQSLAESFGFVVTSTTGGTHNRGSKHALGLAIDVRTRGKENAEIDRFMSKCALLGVRVLDERNRPTHQKVWSGAHLHLEITSETLEAVRRFQEKRGLVPDGIAGAKTIAVLKLE